MKYGYKNGPESLIEKYEIVDDKIQIHFLDGDTACVLFDDDKEQFIVNQMLCQAEERNQSSALIEAYDAKNLSMILGTGFSIPTLILLGTAHLVSPSIKGLYALSGILLANAVAEFWGNAKRNKDKIEELKKYAIYLSMRPLWEQFYAMSQSDLNINTLDCYSLEQIRQMRDNLLQEEHGPVKYK